MILAELWQFHQDFHEGGGSIFHFLSKFRCILNAFMRLSSYNSGNPSGGGDSNRMSGHQLWMILEDERMWMSFGSFSKSMSLKS